MNTCRCCKNTIKGKPILTYKNMPGLAQNFPTEGELTADKGIDLDIYQCDGCGLVQILAEPVSYYKDVIRAVAVSSDMKEFRKQYFKDFVEKCDLKGKRVIEIGAGCGEYMKMLSEYDLSVSGIEHLEASVATAVADGLDVTRDFIENAKHRIKGCKDQGKDGFDAFYIMNFLEHIPEPVEFLKGIGNNLCEGAYGLVEVPNGDAIFAESAFSEFMLDHLSYFSKETLSTTLSLAGFEVVSCEVIWQDYILSAIVKKRKKISVDGFKKREEKFIKEINNFIDEAKADGLKVAVWGAGHESLANIALSDIAGKIECVIDSAAFKQNKYTPATHVKILSPDALKELEIGAIIVMCGSYSSEVERIAKTINPAVRTKIFGLNQ